MVFYGIIILIFIAIGGFSYQRLKSFENPFRIAIVVILSIVTIIMQLGLTVYGLSMNPNLAEIGQGLILLIIVVPATVITAQVVIMPLMCSVINKYNQGKIGRKKFIIYMILTILINDIVVLWFYG